MEKLMLKGGGPSLLSLRKDFPIVLSSVDKNMNLVSCDDEVDSRKS